MPRYDFRALDGAGGLQTGTLDAASPNDVVRLLASRGMRVQYVGPAKAAGVAIAPQAVPRPQSVPQAPTHPGFDAVTRPASARDKDTYFIFTQLGNILRSGLNPAQAMEDLARRQSRRGYADAFRHIAQLSAQGTPLSTAMSLYPQIFAPGSCGAVAAGETGGYLPEACEQVAQEAQRAMKLKRIYGWVSFIFWSNFITLPLMGAGAQTIDATVASINTSEGTSTQGVLGVMSRSIVAGVFGPWGLMCLLLLAAYLIGGYFMRQWTTRGFRHQLAASLPLVGQRTKGEVAASFAWHLEMLGRAGISPYRAWNLAAKAVPNMASSEKLLKPGDTMTEQTRLSEGFHQTNLFPQEMAHVLETGEMTGSMGRALEDARQMGQSQQQVYQAVLVAKAWVWMGLILIIAAAVGIGALYGAYLNGAVKHGLATGDEETQNASVPVQSR